MARAAANGTQPRDFLPRQRGRRRCRSRLDTNCLHTAWTVSLCRPSIMLLPVVDQIEAARPALVVTARCLLDLSAVVPDAVYRPGQRFEMRASSGVLDPVAVGQYHARAVF